MTKVSEVPGGDSMDDPISRQEGIAALMDEFKRTPTMAIRAQHVIEQLPSAQTEIKPIEYRECANAMLRMWMDNVVTDGEYNRIMSKLYAHWGMKYG